MTPTQGMPELNNKFEAADQELPLRREAASFNKSLQPTRMTPLVLRFGFLFCHVAVPAWLSSKR
jgi:hypothetical protein